MVMVDADGKLTVFPVDSQFKLFGLVGKSVKSCVIYRTKKKHKISPASQTVATVQIVTKIQPPQMTTCTGSSESELKQSRGINRLESFITPYIVTFVLR